MEGSRLSLAVRARGEGLRRAPGQLAQAGAKSVGALAYTKGRLSSQAAAGAETVHDVDVAKLREWAVDLTARPV
jgi:hypothetical protein